MDSGGRSRSRVYWLRPTRRPVLPGGRLAAPTLPCEREALGAWLLGAGAAMVGGVERVEGGNGGSSGSDSAEQWISNELQRRDGGASRRTIYPPPFYATPPSSGSRLPLAISLLPELSLALIARRGATNALGSVVGRGDFASERFVRGRGVGLGFVGGGRRCRARSRPFAGCELPATPGQMGLWGGSGQGTHSSLSLRLRFCLREPSLPVTAFSLLLSSIARRSSSASS